jgi:hypothetical protein
VREDRARDDETEERVASRRRPTHQQLAVGLGTAVVAIAIGVGGYFIGHSTGPDLDSARAEGEAAGRIRGAEVGTRRGYAVGYRQGRKRGARQAFAPAYRRAYTKAYEVAGLEPPAKGEIDVPR